MNGITYLPPGPIADHFLNSDARRRVILGPFGSGKSVACCVEIMRRAREQAPSADGVRRTRWAIVRNTYPDLKNTTVKTWRDWWGDRFGVFSRVAPFVHHLKYPLVDDTWVDCEVIFLAMDDEADAKKFLSLELTGIYFNELRELKRGLIEAGDGRLGRYPSMKDGGPSWYGMIADATITWTNYATGNTGAAARLKLTGSPAAACTLTFPGYHNFLSVENTTAQTVTIKCAGGTGVAIAAGARASIYCDGVDYYNAAPTVIPGAMTVAGALTIAGQISGVSAATVGTQAVNKTQMETAIAAGAIPAASGAVKVDAAAAPGYLYDVLTVSGSLVKADNGDTMNIGFTFDEGNQVLLGGVLSI